MSERQADVALVARHDGPTRFWFEYIYYFFEKHGVVTVEFKQEGGDMRSRKGTTFLKGLARCQTGQRG